MYIQEKDLKLNKGYYIQRKYLPYEGKLMLAKRRIMEWYDYWDGQVYVSFSGGMDSTVLLALVRMTLEVKSLPFSAIPDWSSPKSSSLPVLFKPMALMRRYGLPRISGR